MRPGNDPLNRRTPDGRPFDPTDPPVGLPGDRALNSELELWLYIAKGLLILIVCAFILTNAMYLMFEALVWLAGE